MVASELYILYGFLAFIGLLQVPIVVALIRQSHSIGRMEGQLSSITTHVERLEEQMVNFREQLADFREQLAEVRGMVRALNDRMDLLMRHRHDDAGRVVITPEEVVAD